jgi:hypothetical protein
MKFIRLSKIIFNPNYIKKINVESQAIELFLSDSASNGFMMGGAGIMFRDGYELHRFTKQDYPKDYEKLLKWIEDNSH